MITRFMEDNEGRARRGICSRVKNHGMEYGTLYCIRTANKEGNLLPGYKRLLVKEKHSPSGSCETHIKTGATLDPTAIITSVETALKKMLLPI